MDKYDSFTRYYSAMIDTWLFTAFVLGVIALCVILRGFSARSQDDRLVAGTTAVILVAMTALVFSIAWGMLIILGIIILLAIIVFGVLIYLGKHVGVDST
jgi:multisubunit Na+/H+ antiporter MnhF subunit